MKLSKISFANVVTIVVAQQVVISFERAQLYEIVMKGDECSSLRRLKEKKKIIILVITEPLPFILVNP